MCVLGLCALIDLEHVPQVLNQVSGQILPAFILLFNGLKRAYACHAEHENDSDDDDDEAEEDEEAGNVMVFPVKMIRNITDVAVESFSGNFWCVLWFFPVFVSSLPFNWTEVFMYISFFL